MSHKPWLNIFVYAFLLLVCLCDRVSVLNLVMSKERILYFLPAGFWCLNRGLKPIANSTNTDYFAK